MKTVTIHNWDGTKYDIQAPDEAKYLGILSHTGVFIFYRRRPRLQRNGYYIKDHHGGMLLDPHGEEVRAPDGHEPYHDGYGSAGTVIKNGIHVSELLLEIEEV